MDRIKSEPVLFAGFVSSALACAGAFGFDLSAEQVAALNGLVVAGLSVLVRSKVTPVP